MCAGLRCLFFNEHVDTTHKITVLRLTNVAAVPVRLVKGEVVPLVDDMILLEVIEELGFDKAVVSVFVDARLLRLPVPAMFAVVLVGSEIMILEDEREVPEKFRLGANVACELVTGACECLI